MFQRTYGGSADDICSQAVQTADGGYIMVGMTESFGAGNDKCYVIKTDPRGDTLWTRVFGGPYLDDGNSISQTTDGGYIMVGDTGTGMGSSDVWLMRTDANGGILWTRVYAVGYAASVEQTADGGYVAAGRTAPFGTSGDVLLIKTDDKGETLWTRAYGGGGDDDGKCVQQTTDGGYVVAGTTTSFGAGEHCVWLIKTDSMGDTLWTRTFGEDSLDFGGSVQQTDDGGYFLAGYKWPWSSDSASFYLVKTNSVGDTLWTKTIGGPGGFAEGMCGRRVEDGGYIVVGACGTGLPDVYLVRTDANGDTLWTRTFGGPDFDDGYSVQQTSDQGYIIGGQTYSLGAGRSDFYLVKTDENGNLAVAEPKASPPLRPVLSVTCEPNPFRSSTVLHLTAGPLDHSVTQLRVHDVQGRLVRTLTVNRSPQVVWDGRDNSGRTLPSGTYLVCCTVAGKSAAARVILQR
ncbi:MAG TPA: T9SS type A sorting domain-containing protein [bacterium]|nr:T9SS type A sorting domain-containing protein [bacterium]